MSNFFILGLPRSRTAWLSVFMTYGNSFCYHEGLNGCSNIEAYQNKLGVNKGDSCTGLMMLDLDKHFLGSKKVIIERDIGSAIKFAKRIYGLTDDNWIEPLIERLDKVDGLRIKFEDIDDRLEEIWNHLTEQPYNSERSELLKKMNIQVTDPCDVDLESMQGLFNELQYAGGL